MKMACVLTAKTSFKFSRIKCVVLLFAVQSQMFLIIIIITTTVVVIMIRDSYCLKNHSKSTESAHCGDCLLAAPIVSVGLRLLDEATRVAVVHRLGCWTCRPHLCMYGKTLDTQGLHELAFNRRQLRCAIYMCV